MLSNRRLSKMTDDDRKKADAARAKWSAQRTNTQKPVERRRLTYRVKRLNCTMVEEPEKPYEKYGYIWIEAPAGKQFVATHNHGTVCGYYPGRKADAYEELVRDLTLGLEPCKCWRCDR